MLVLGRVSLELSEDVKAGLYGAFGGTGVC